MKRKQKNRVHNSFLRRAVSLFLAAVLVCCACDLTFLLKAFASGGEDLLYKDSYDVKVVIQVTNEASGWNSAKMEVYAKDVNGTDSKENKVDTVDIMKSIEDEGDVYTYTKNTGLSFPSKIKIYTDFGGGFTWRKWEADVKIYVNGAVVKAGHIFASSSAFSSADRWHTMEVDASKYPYPEKINILNHLKSIEELPDKENFFEFASEKDSDTAVGNVFINACDQYGTKWNETNIGLVCMTDGDECEPVKTVETEDASKGWLVSLSSSLGTDHYAKYAVTCETSNTLHPTATEIFETGFYFTHKMTFIANGKDKYVYYGTRGKTVDLSELVPIGYSMSKLVITDGTGKVSDTEFVFGRGDAEVTASVKPNTYTVVFDGNGADSGSVKEQIFTYDVPQKLGNNTFKKTDHVYGGWNTKPDGSGQPVSNREKILNMTTVPDETITLYAQWTYTGPVVTLVYPEEMNRENEFVQTGTGGSVRPEEMIEIEGGKEHYRFVSADRSLENITEDQVINLSYKIEEHEHSKEVVILAPTCTEKGILHKICGCGHIEEEEIEPLGHMYEEAVWDWDYENETAKASFTCVRCGEETVVPASVSVTGDEDLQITTYRAKASIDGIERTDEQYRQYHIVKYDINGGYGSLPELKFYEEEYVLPVLSKTQYRRYCSFDGWMIGDELYQPGDTVPAGNMTLVASWSFSWNNIQKAINGGVRYISLPCDVKAEDGDTALVIPSGKNVTIDLNGHILDRNAVKTSEDGSAFIVDGGTLNIEDRKGGGIIMGGNAVNGGAVCVKNNGRLVIYSGQVAMNNASDGGGAFYASSGKIYLWGGEVTGNYAANGAGIYLDGKDSLLSVSSSPRLYANGATGTSGGICVAAGTFDISGSPYIAENRLENGAYSNITLAAGTVIDISGNLGKDALIGISGPESTAFTSKLKGSGTPASFVSDNEAFVPSLNEKGELILSLKPVETEAETEPETEPEKETEASLQGSTFSGGHIFLICGGVLLLAAIVVCVVVALKRKK